MRAQEKLLLRQMYEHVQNAGVFPHELSNTVHTMAAHVHRYKAEINVLEQISTYVPKDHKSPCDIPDCPLETTIPAFADHLSSISSVTSDIGALQKLVLEMERKTQTVIALVSRNISNSCDSTQGNWIGLQPTSDVTR